MKDPEPVPEKESRNGNPKSKWDRSKMTCFNYNATGSDVKPRGDKGNVGEIEVLYSVR